MLTVIKNARLVDSEIDRQGSLLLQDERIIATGSIDAFSALEAEAAVIDAQGQTLMPAFVDLHAHFRDPGLTYKEDLLTGAQAALAGGYTAVNLMANTKPVCDTSEKQAAVMQRAADLDLIDIYQEQAITVNMQGEELTDFSSSLTPLLSDDGKGIADDKLMYKALEQAAANGKILQLHEENPEFAPDITGLAEETMVARDLTLAAAAKALVYLCHISTAKALKMVEIAKQNGVQVICEVTPHHLALADNPYKVHPPLRSAADCQALIEGIRKGTVDIIGTDHAPHSEADKAAGAPGLVGLETAFSVLYTVLVEENKISLSKLSQLLSLRGAEILNLEQGRVLPGYKANLTLVDLTASRTIKPEKFHSKSHNTPFAGRTYRGEILWTMHNGKIKWRKETDK